MIFSAAILSSLVFSNAVSTGMITQPKPDLDLGTGYLNTPKAEGGAPLRYVPRAETNTVMVFIPKGKKPNRKLNAFSEGRVIELSLDESLTKGTNAVYRAGREFPVMFKTPSIKRREHK